MTNIAMERSPIFKFGKPSISMGYLYHGYVTVITRGYQEEWLSLGDVLGDDPTIGTRWTRCWHKRKQPWDL